MNCFSELYLELSHKCTASCKHCYLRCSPDTESEILKKNIVTDLLRGVKSSGFIDNKVAIAGGEPTIYRELLFDILDEAYALDFKTVIVTNACWGSSFENAMCFVKELKQHHIDTVEISYSVFHNEYIPKSFVENALKVLDILGINVTIQHRYSFISINKDFDFLDDYNHISTPVISLNNQFEDNYPVLKTFPNGNCFGGLSLTVKPNGDVYPCCCGTELFESFKLGNVYSRSLDDIIESFNSNQALQYIIKFGPAKASKLLIDNNYEVKSNGCLQICNMCTDVYGKEENINKLNELLRQECFESKIETNINYSLLIKQCLNDGVIQPSGAKLLFTNNFVIKASDNDSSGKLAQQCNILKMMNNYNISCAPEVLYDYNEKNTYAYIMPIYNQANVDDNKSLLSSIIISQLKKIWKLKINNNNNINGYINKVCNILSKYDNELADRFGKLGYELLLPLRNLDCCLVHGDATFENLAFKPMDGSPVLLDPNPQSDPMISLPHLDVAKIMQSVIGWEQFTSFKVDIIAPTKDTLRNEITELFGEDQWPIVVWLMISHLIRTLPYGAKVGDANLLIPSIKESIKVLEKNL